MQHLVLHAQGVFRNFRKYVIRRHILSQLFRRKTDCWSQFINFLFLFFSFLKVCFSSHRFMFRRTELISFFFASQDFIFCSLIASELLIVKVYSFWTAHTVTRLPHAVATATVDLDSVLNFHSWISQTVALTNFHFENCLLPQAKSWFSGYNENLIYKCVFQNIF